MRPWVAAAAMFVLAASCLYAFNKDFLRGDEVIYRDAAGRFADGDFLTTRSGLRDYGDWMPWNPEHPPLAKLLLALPVAAGGQIPRIFAAAAGATTVVALFLIMRAQSSVVLAWLSCTLLLFDPLFLRYAGLTQLDTFQIAFGMLAVLAASRGHIATAGLCVGLATACKLPGIFFAIPVAFLAVRLRGKLPASSVVTAMACALGGYLASYAPFMVAWIHVGGLSEALEGLVRVHVYMFQFHETAPFWHRSVIDQFYGPGGHPARGEVWWNPAPWVILFFVLLVRAIFEFAGQLQARLLTGIAALGFAGSFLPLVMLTRGGDFVHYLLPCLVFLYMTPAIFAHGRSAAEDARGGPDPSVPHRAP